MQRPRSEISAITRGSNLNVNASKSCYSRLISNTANSELKSRDLEKNLKLNVVTHWKELKISTHIAVVVGSLKNDSLFMLLKM